MEVILKTDLPHVGRAGQILKVKNGFARNYLFPRKLAIPLKSQSLKEWNHKKKLSLLQAKKAQLLRDEIAKKLEGLKLSFHKSFSAKGKLFGSVTLSEISEKLREKGFDIDKKFIKLSSPIKEAGKYRLEIDLGKDSKSCIEVEVLQKVPSKNEDKKSSGKISKLIEFSKSLKFSKNSSEKKTD